MINDALSFKQLGVLLPSTNKALAEVLKSASPKELESLSSFKDLKSMMNSILKQSTSDTSSNKVLLELVKNNPTLKNLGDVSTTIKDLLQSIKSDKNPLTSEPQQKLNSLDKIVEISTKNPNISSKELKEIISTEVKTLLQSSTKETLKNLLNNDLEKILKSTIKNTESQQKLNSLDTILETNTKTPNISSKDIKDIISTEIKTLLQSNTKETQKESSPIEKTLKNFLLNIKDLKAPELKQKLLNSGVFLESNLKNTQTSPEKLKDIISNDLKVILHKANEELSESSHPNKTEILKHIDKLTLQIDNYQLLSHLSNQTSLYLPFSWDQLDEGNIALKKVKDDRFFCNIDLKLKDFGDINLKLVLYDKNQLNIHVYAKSDEFKSLVKENIAELRSALIGVNITPRELRVFDYKEDKKVTTSAYNSMDDNLKMGFEIKA